jgi:hypothetical protein
VAALLVATSVSASSIIRDRAGADQAELLGSPRNWIDRSAHGGVTYIYDGEYAWNSVWQQRFWNDRVDHVLSFAPARVPGPMPQTVRPLSSSGFLATRDRYVVAPDRYEFVGTPVAEHARGVDLAKLRLWHLDGRPRLSLATNGIQPNGDMIGPATIVAYGCAGGVLHLTLLPKATSVVTISLDGTRVRRVPVAGLESWTTAIRVPRSHVGTCRFKIRGGLLLGSTVRSFERA